MRTTCRTVSARPQDVGGNGPGDGPAVRTPLAESFYAAWQASGLTEEAVARRSGLSVATVSAYFNGTRGGGGQVRTRPTIAALARVLGMDVEATLGLAGLAKDPGVVEAIRSDPSLPKRDKEELIYLYERRRRPT